MEQIEQYLVVGCDIDIMSDIHETGHEVLGYVAPNSRKVGFEYLGDEDCIYDFQNSVKIVLCIDSISDRKRIIEKFGKHLSSYISPLAFVSKNSQIGVGVTIYPLVYISGEVKVCDNVKISTRANILHNTVIENNSVLCPSVNLLGRSVIQQNSFIGTNATSAPNLTVGFNSKIGMGSVVLRDIPPNSVAYGNPARIIRQNYA